MRNKVKILAMYLPQYHSIPENDEFWGKDFSDWVTVKKAKPLYSGHQQPKIPLGQHYYDLSMKEDVAWQAKIARENGIDGFGIYHYWFSNEKNLLTKPAQIILENKEIEINFFYAWDNTSWKRSWSNVKGGNSWAPNLEVNVKHDGPEILIPYILGNESDWENHYNYLRPFFLDSRYIKKDNKPIFAIYHGGPDVEKMCEYWSELARNDGFDGMFFIFREDRGAEDSSGFAYFKYEPLYSGWSKMGVIYRVYNKILKIIYHRGRLNVYNYDHIWHNIIKNAKNDKSANMYHGGFVNYDDTPRRGRKGIVVKGGSPSKFKCYLKRLIEITEAQGKEFIFLTAWNEWGEGAFLEPDTSSEYSYLKAIKALGNE